jgi:hypothetical protein
MAIILMWSRFLSILVPILMASVGYGVSPQAEERDNYFIIKVIDDETGRGVPMVEFKTTSHCRYYSDSHGIIAFHEPSLMSQQVYFEVFSHGYECEKDRFDNHGVLLQTTPGDSAVVKIKRLNIAERLYRITGQDIYGASACLGRPIPITRSGLNGKVLGQDTFIETVHKGKIYWFWGDTFGPAYFNGSASGATSELPGNGGLDPNVGIDLTYFVDSTGFSKPMCPIPGPGLVWIDWLVTVPDGKGGEKLYAKFSRTKTLGEDYERGIAVFNDSLEMLEKVVRVDAWLDKVHSSGHPLRVRVDNHEYIYIMDRYGFERVLADSQHITNAASYEHFTCLATGVKFDSIASILDRNANGQLVYDWKPATDALSRKQQAQLVSSGKVKHVEGLWQSQDVESGRPVAIDPVSVFWNDYRKCWIMLAYEYCGSVWYFEGDTPIGPWVFGQKIVSHESYDFYNVGQHPLFDQDGGRVIYFEGTYTTGFSGNTNPTPLYDYNQMMYRLSLDDSRLSLPAPVYRVKDVQDRERYLMRAAVDSLNLWERVIDIPFFAIPPHQAAAAMIPVFLRRGKGTDRLLVNPRAKDGKPPLCYVLPPDSESMSALDPISGTWRCVARSSDGSDYPFELELSLGGNKVSGPNVTRGEFEHGRLELELHIEGYNVKGVLKERKLVGDLIKDDRTEKGMWTGQRVMSAADKLVSTSVVFLYGYQDQKTGDWSYSVNPILDDHNLKRLPKPICRVWKNPSSLLLLDYKARPVAVPLH